MSPMWWPIGQEMGTIRKCGNHSELAATFLSFPSILQVSETIRGAEKEAYSAICPAWV